MPYSKGNASLLPAHFLEDRVKLTKKYLPWNVNVNININTHRRRLKSYSLTFPCETAVLYNVLTLLLQNRQKNVQVKRKKHCLEPLEPKNIHLPTLSSFHVQEKKTVNEQTKIDTQADTPPIDIHYTHTHTHTHTQIHTQIHTHTNKHTHTHTHTHTKQRTEIG